MTRPVQSLLLPNSPLFSRRQLQFLLHQGLPQAGKPTQHCRHVTGSATAKPGPGPRKHEAPAHASATREQLILGMPDKYRPPSHGRRIKERVPRSYGPDLTKEQKIEHESKQYPHSFPPEGTVMHWFLTNRQIHAYIALGTLFCLAAFTTFENWRKDSPFKSQLPSLSDTFSHPIDSFWKTFYLIRLDTVKTTIKTDSMRKNEINDVHKRNTYRKHHGIEDKQGIGPWMPAEKRLEVWKAKRAAEGQPVEEPPKRAKRKWLGFDWD